MQIISSDANKRRINMARPKGSKVVKCPGENCDARIVGFLGKTSVCKKCGTKVKFTKALLEKKEQ
jgi:hypothetical protein